MHQKLIISFPCSLLLLPGFSAARFTMSWGNGGSGLRSARRELQLNLSPPAPAGMMEVDGHDSDSSSPSSCVSSDGGGPGEQSPMVIGACTRCLMYCMVAKKDYPTCINCKQPCLVDLLHGDVGGSCSGVVVDAPDDKKRGKRK